MRKKKTSQKNPTPKVNGHHKRTTSELKKEWITAQIEWTSRKAVTSDVDFLWMKWAEARLQDVDMILTN